MECHFSWQAQHFVKFWEIAGAQCVSKMRLEMLDRTCLDCSHSDASHSCHFSFSSYIVLVILTCFHAVVFRVLLLMGFFLLLGIRVLVLCVVALLHLQLLFLVLLVRATLAICLALAIVHLSEAAVRDDDFMLGFSSDYLRIILQSSLYWPKQFRDFSTVLLNSEFRI